MIKINLGCGKKYLPGYINTDIVKAIKADKYFDLNKFPYTFKANYADEILMDNVLEHVDDVSAVLKEIHRILKKKGKLKIYVPYAKSDGAFQDPTHKHFFTEKSMDYFTENFAYSYYTPYRFTILKKELTNSKSTIMSKIRAYIPFRGFLKYFLFNMYDGVYFELEAVKK